MERRSATVLEALISVALLAAFAVAFYDFLGESPHFRIRDVQISGASMASAEQVLAKSGVTTNSRLFFFDRAEIARRVEEIPYVRAASVRLVFPNTVEIRIEEREPYGTLMINSRSYEIDAEGNVLRQYSVGELPRGPFITAVPGLEIVEVGQRIVHPAVKAAIRLNDAYARSKMGDILTVSEIAARHEDELLMYCNEIPYVLIWGRVDFDEQFRRLSILWEEKDGVLGCTEYLDLRFGTNIPCGRYSGQAARFQRVGRSSSIGRGSAP